MAVKELVAKVFNEAAEILETGTLSKPVRIGLTLLGSEHGMGEILSGAEQAQKSYPGLKVVLFGPEVATGLERIHADDEKKQHEQMEIALISGRIAAAVTMHYNFPIGVATVGKVITPGRGREMFIASTTGTSATNRVEAMIKNAIFGIAAAKASGIANPSLGILNLDGARAVERGLQRLAAAGYPIKFAESMRKDGGFVMRGNDLLAGVPDIMVTDTLTGNVLMKVFSAFTSGGDYESLGSGYGPGLGEGYDRIILILSRASGAPVVAKAIKYAAEMAQGKVMQVVAQEFAAAKKAGLESLFACEERPVAQGPEALISPPPAKLVTEEIAGIDILDLEQAVSKVWKAGIFATTGMGCTGPIILVAKEDRDQALNLLVQSGYIKS